jgi:hypothetical protein
MSWTNFSAALPNAARAARTPHPSANAGIINSMILIVLLAGTCGASVVTVTGRNTYPDDLNAVQASLNAPGVNQVTLVGTFNFGDPSNTVNCSAMINNPGITLQGQRGSEIDGGCDGVDVYAPGVEIRGLTLKGFGTFGIGVWANGRAGAKISVHNNVITSTVASVHAGVIAYGVTSPVDVRNNTISVSGPWGPGGLWAQGGLAPENFTGNTVNVAGPTAVGALAVSMLSPANVAGNTVNAGGNSAAGVELAYMLSPVSVIGNTVNTTGPGDAGIFAYVNSAHVQIEKNKTSSTGNGMLVYLASYPDIPQGLNGTITVENNDVTVADFMYDPTCYNLPITDPNSFTCPDFAGGAIASKGATSWLGPDQTSDMIPPLPIPTVNVPCPFYAAGSGPCLDWPEQPTILVENNRLHLQTVAGSPFTMGDCANVADNEIIQYNKVDGTGAGVWIAPYGSNNVFFDNDLSQFTAVGCDPSFGCSSQLEMNKPGTIVAGNTFGPSAGPTVWLEWLNLEFQPWHAYYVGYTPDGRDVANNVFKNNDYTQTSKTGFTADDLNSGNIFLSYSRWIVEYSSLTDTPYTAYDLTHKVHGNVIWETKYPNGTDANSQVFLDSGTWNNFVLGRNGMRNELSGPIGQLTHGMPMRPARKTLRLPAFKKFESEEVKSMMRRKAAQQ